MRPELVVGGGVTAPDIERAMLGRMARALALALADPAMRQQLKQHLRDAPFMEHKVELTTYLRGDKATAIVARMAARGGETPSAVLANLASVRSVELYMPLPQHRENWVGNEEVLVGAQLVEHDPIMAFNARGEAVFIDENNLPAQPTLAIVGTETRFDRPMNVLTSRNINDKNGAAIGTLIPISNRMSAVGEGCDSQTAIIECNDQQWGGGGTAPPGLYLKFSRILDDKEPDFRGTPEVEVHMHAASNDNTPLTSFDLSCSGEWAPNTRKRFDQNGGFWEGEVLLFSDAEIAAYPTDRDFQVIYWEDDNEPCVLKLDSPVIRDYLVATLRATGSAAMMLLKGYQWPVAATAFIANIYANAGEWMLTNDDYIGVAVVQDPDGPCCNLWPYYPENTHVIMDGSNLNGRATLDWVLF